MKEADWEVRKRTPTPARADVVTYKLKWGLQEYLSSEAPIDYNDGG